MRLVSWNVNQLDVRDWLAGTGADLALLKMAVPRSCGFKSDRIDLESKSGDLLEK